MAENSRSPTGTGWHADREKAELSSDISKNLQQRPRTYRPPPPRYSEIAPQGPLQKILGVRLPKKPVSQFWDISIADGKISSIDPHTSSSLEIRNVPGVLDGTGRLLAPSLCHAHIHLDKCFLLQDPKYSHLEIVKGDFGEAMSLTNSAKAHFEDDDLLRRGRQLIEESIRSGVTSMRAFVEVDGMVQMKCLDAGLTLKREFERRCHVQLCAFAQLPLFSGQDGGNEVRRLMTEAATRVDVDVIGSTPYVEQDDNKMRMNVRWISTLALSHKKFLDMHMDYHLDERKSPLMWDALRIIRERNWVERGGKTVTMGHCTRLTQFKSSEWHFLKEEIGTLDVSFIGLPTSDLFMMRTQPRVRGTLYVPELIKEYGLNAAIAVNNVGNAFTPQGSCDPLTVASLGVGLYHAGTKQDTELLYECVSTRAKAAIGEQRMSLGLAIGDAADFVLFEAGDVEWRRCKTLTEAVYHPGGGRQTVFEGRLTTE